jgi:hypothetical protein
MQRPHWREWWGEVETELGYIRDMVEGRDTTRPYLFELDGEPAGYIQAWIIADHLREPWLGKTPWLRDVPADSIGVELDLHDRERFTVWSDCAFWLHVISAPLLVHPLFILSTGQDVSFGTDRAGHFGLGHAGLMIAAFVYVALAIDRRSLLVPTLAYFGSLGIYYLVNGRPTPPVSRPSR